MQRSEIGGVHGHELMAEHLKTARANDRRELRLEELGTAVVQTAGCELLCKDPQRADILSVDGGDEKVLAQLAKSGHLQLQCSFEDRNDCVAVERDVAAVDEAEDGGEDGQGQRHLDLDEIRGAIEVGDRAEEEVFEVGRLCGEEETVREDPLAANQQNDIGERGGLEVAKEGLIAAVEKLCTPAVAVLLEQRRSCVDGGQGGVEVGRTNAGERNAEVACGVGKTLLVDELAKGGGGCVKEDGVAVVDLGADRKLEIGEMFTTQPLSE